ncbi:MAG TPA: hypothetical protein PLT66_06150 [Bacillota bacterium]|nr:hypothetical protein [Bacillota bacterium]
MYCKYCGRQIEPSRFCIYCGRNLTNEQPVAPLPIVPELTQEQTDTAEKAKSRAVLRIVLLIASVFVSFVPFAGTLALALCCVIAIRSFKERMTLPANTLCGKAKAVLIISPFAFIAALCGFSMMTLGYGLMAVFPEAYNSLFTSLFTV